MYDPNPVLYCIFWFCSLCIDSIELKETALDRSTYLPIYLSIYLQSWVACARQTSICSRGSRAHGRRRTLAGGCRRSTSKSAHAPTCIECADLFLRVCPWPPCSRTVTQTRVDGAYVRESTGLSTLLCGINPHDFFSHQLDVC